jgi:peptidoglycan/LPS O-acetylase OafA/YrhL
MQYFKVFYLRRALRIFPLYYVVVPVVLLSLAFLSPHPPSTTDWVSALTYTQNNLWPIYSTTLMPTLGHTWTLAVEEQFYLVWPVIVYFIPTRFLPTVILSGVGAALSLRLFPLWYLNAGNVIFLIPPRLDCLLMGSSLALASSRGWVRFGPGWAVAGLCSFLIFLVGNLILTPEKTTIFNDNVGISMAALASASIIVFCESARHGTPLFSNPVLVNIGKMSYGIYLFHLPVFSALSRVLEFRLKAFSYPTTFALFFLTGTLTTLALASISYRYFEKPLLSLKSRINYPRNQLTPKLGLEN